MFLPGRLRCVFKDRPRIRGGCLTALLYVVCLLQAAPAQTQTESLERSSRLFQNYRENAISIHSGDPADAGFGFIAATHNDFQNIGDTVVLDKISGLYWQKYGDETMRNWSEAKSYCEGLELEGGNWRLPSRAELLSLVDFGRSQPAIDTAYFPTTRSFNYWAVTPYTGTPGHAWSILFSEGNAYCFLRELKSYVRCVRN
ncbi:MAG: DUF1566 domain-containing protein [Gammaproteobacteria bacterium]|nr:DUF1566 domain-containing protein [Gammaproteobacteria bacterium]